MAQSQPLFLVQMRLDALEEEMLLLLRDLKVLKQNFHTQNQQQNEEKIISMNMNKVNTSIHSQSNERKLIEHSSCPWHKKQLSHIQNLEQQQRQKAEERNRVRGTNIDESNEVYNLQMEKDCSTLSTQGPLNVENLKERQILALEDSHIQLLEFHSRELSHWLAGEKHVIELMAQLGEVRFQRVQLEKRLAELEVQMLKQDCQCSDDTSNMELSNRVQAYKKENRELLRDLAMEREQSMSFQKQVIALTSELDGVKAQYKKLEEEKMSLLQQVAAGKELTEKNVSERNRQEMLLSDQSNLVRKLQQQVAQLEGKIKKREKELCFISGKGSADDMIKCEAMLQAAWAGNVQELRLQLESGGDIHSRNYVAQTALHLAAGNGYTDLCAMLLDHGAIVDPRDLWKNTPLHFASCNGHLDTVNLLLDRGAKFRAQNRDGRTPKDWAALCKHVKIVKYFEEKENLEEYGDKIISEEKVIVNKNVEEKIES